MESDPNQYELDLRMPEKPILNKYAGWVCSLSNDRFYNLYNTTNTNSTDIQRTFYNWSWT